MNLMKEQQKSEFQLQFRQKIQKVSKHGPINTNIQQDQQALTNPEKENNLNFNNLQFPNKPKTQHRKRKLVDQLKHLSQKDNHPPKDSKVNQYLLNNQDLQNQFIKIKQNNHEKTDKKKKKNINVFLSNFEYQDQLILDRNRVSQANSESEYYLTRNNLIKSREHLMQQRQQLIQNTQNNEQSNYKEEQVLKIFEQLDHKKREFLKNQSIVRQSSRNRMRVETNNNNSFKVLAPSLPQSNRNVLQRGRDGSWSTNQSEVNNSRRMSREVAAKLVLANQ